MMKNHVPLKVTYNGAEGTMTPIYSCREEMQNYIRYGEQERDAEELFFRCVIDSIDTLLELPKAELRMFFLMLKQSHKKENRDKDLMVRLVQAKDKAELLQVCGVGDTTHYVRVNALLSKNIIYKGATDWYVINPKICAKTAYTFSLECQLYHLGLYPRDVEPLSAIDVDTDKFLKVYTIGINQFLAMGDSELRVFLSMAKRLNSKRRNKMTCAWKSMALEKDKKLIMKDTGLSETDVDRALKHLIVAKHIYPVGEGEHTINPYAIGYTNEQNVRKERIAYRQYLRGRSEQ